MKFIVIFFIIICFNQYVSAQNNNYYTYQQLAAYKTFLAENAAANASLLNKKIQKQYLNIINEKNKELASNFEQKNFLFDTVAYPYLLSIFNHILERNALDKKHFHFFIDRTSEVNAYSYEDGTVVCDLGLASIMENESQIAMVFCHELGHYLLKHINTSVINQLEKYNSPEFLAKIKAIEKKEYNTKEKLEDLLIDDLYDRKKHNRAQEKAADSLAMRLFLKTGYNCKTVSRVFDFLDSVSVKTTMCTFSDFFKQEQISIDNDQQKIVKKMRFGKPLKKEVMDSLKTHPDCPQRKIWMQAFFNDIKAGGTDFLIADVKKLNDVKKRILFEAGFYARDNQNMGFYLYRLIQNNALFHSNKEIITEVFNTMLSICNHSKSHTLYEVVASPYTTNDDKDEYAKLLVWLDHVSLKQMVDITNAYYINHKSLITTSNEVVINLNTLNTLNN